MGYPHPPDFVQSLRRKDFRLGLQLLIFAKEEEKAAVREKRFVKDKGRSS
jgi:hypothetical protein